MSGEMVVGLAATWAGSADGKEAATLVGSIMGSAISGAIIGSAIPAAGTVVGTCGWGRHWSCREGYNAERMKSLREEANFMTSEDPERANEVDKAIGAYYASLDNKRDELRREAEKEAYKEIDEKGYARDGAEVERIIKEARARAEMQYNASEEAKKEFDMQGP